MSYLPPLLYIWIVLWMLSPLSRAKSFHQPHLRLPTNHTAVTDWSPSLTPHSSVTLSHTTHCPLGPPPPFSPHLISDNIFAMPCPPALVSLRSARFYFTLLAHSLPFTSTIATIPTRAQPLIRCSTIASSHPTWRLLSSYASLFLSHGRSFSNQLSLTHPRSRSTTSSSPCTQPTLLLSRHRTLTMDVWRLPE
ncbi:MAG: hypothetical protein J3Q66DRAFT_155817 [Benniella sp.]|nr:MAG: hypothetical protein J3Q66DRAFT_155817 [Benniella sp.]